MANWQGFIRKSPRGRLGAYLQARGAIIPDDFEWKADRKQREFLDAVTAIIDDQLPKMHDGLKAELDLLASLANESGTVAIHQIGAWEDIDLEGFEGVEDKLLYLAVDRPALINRIAANASFSGQAHGKYWSTFQLTGDAKPLWQLNDKDSQDRFIAEVLDILDLPSHRKHESDWYKSIKTDTLTDKDIEIHHANIYVEDQAEAHLSFNDNATLERNVIAKVAEISIACNPKEKCLDIFAKGPKSRRDDCAAAFAKHLAPNTAKTIATPRREVILGRLLDETILPTEPQDRVDKVEVMSLQFRSLSGLLTTFNKPKDDRSIYAMINTEYGDNSPLTCDKHEVIAAIVRIIRSPTDARRKKTLTVKLRCPNSTTMPNKTEQDWHLVQGLLERWGLLEPIEIEIKLDAVA